MNKKIIIDNDFESILICAMRYAIGRQSYMPSIVAGYINMLLPELSDNMLFVMQRDIEEAGSYGDPVIDKPLWMHLLENIRKERENRGEQNERSRIN